MYLGLMFVAILPIALTVDDAAWAPALYGFVLFWALVIALLAHRWYRVTVIESGAYYRVLRFQSLRGTRERTSRPGRHPADPQAETGSFTVTFKARVRRRSACSGSPPAYVLDHHGFRGLPRCASRRRRGSSPEEVVCMQLSTAGRTVVVEGRARAAAESLAVAREVVPRHSLTTSCLPSSGSRSPY